LAMPIKTRAICKSEKRDAPASKKGEGEPGKKGGPTKTSFHPREEKKKRRGS